MMILLGGHCVTIVGYNKKEFIIRNSWGTGWNNGGYTTYPYNQFGVHWEIWTSIDDESPNQILIQFHVHVLLCKKLNFKL